MIFFREACSSGFLLSSQLNDASLLLSSRTGRKRFRPHFFKKPQRSGRFVSLLVSKTWPNVSGQLWSPGCVSCNDLIARQPHPQTATPRPHSARLGHAIPNRDDITAQPKRDSERSSARSRPTVKLSCLQTLTHLSPGIHSTNAPPSTEPGSSAPPQRPALQG